MESRKSEAIGIVIVQFLNLLNGFHSAELSYMRLFCKRVDSVVNLNKNNSPLFMYSFHINILLCSINRESYRSTYSSIKMGMSVITLLNVIPSLWSPCYRFLQQS